jgi:hypothetical protein
MRMPASFLHQGFYPALARVLSLDPQKLKGSYRPAGQRRGPVQPCGSLCPLSFPRLPRQLQPRLHLAGPLLLQLQNDLFNDSPQTGDVLILHLCPHT